MAKEKKAGDKKTVCPVSRTQFVKEAKPVDVVINGVPLVAQVKEFSTGSFGFFLNDKVAIKVGDVTVKCQVGMNITAIGSMNLAKE